MAVTACLARNLPAEKNKKNRDSLQAKDDKRNMMDGEVVDYLVESDRYPYLYSPILTFNDDDDDEEKNNTDLLQAKGVQMDNATVHTPVERNKTDLSQAKGRRVHNATVLTPGKRKTRKELEEEDKAVCKEDWDCYPKVRKSRCPVTDKSGKSHHNFCYYKMAECVKARAFKREPNRSNSPARMATQEENGRYCYPTQFAVDCANGVNCPDP